MQSFVTSEAAYIHAPSGENFFKTLYPLISSIRDSLINEFGSFLFLEIWPADSKKEIDTAIPSDIEQPEFKIVIPNSYDRGHLIDKFVESLSRIKVDGQKSKVSVIRKRRVSPAGLKELIKTDDEITNTVPVGLEISPIWKGHSDFENFPQIKRSLERQLSLALKQVFFHFATNQTTHQPQHFHSLGRRATVKAVWRADEQMYKLSKKFDFLLQVTPINVDQAWKSFKKNKYSNEPKFHYRPLAIDPILLKRELYKVPVDKVEDPAIGQLLRNKLSELDRQINMLQDLNTPRFLPGSLQLYGYVEPALLETAKEILQNLPKTKPMKGATLNSQELAEYATKEIQRLNTQDNTLSSTVEIRHDINGLIVSHGSLLVASSMSVPLPRVEALLQHEVGTHILTYHNGLQQPLKQLSSGLAGYETLQEGIGVLAEYLVDGLSNNRMRLIAARVICVDMMISGLSFVECFEYLVGAHKFGIRQAFGIAMRAFRGGGFTKDTIYLKGLIQVLEYIGKGGDLENLLIGKISIADVNFIKELRWRKVLKEPTLKPSYLNDPTALERLEYLKQGIKAEDLLIK